MLLIRPINAIINNSQIFDRDILLVKLEAVVLTAVLAPPAGVAATFFVRVVPHSASNELVILMVKLS